MSSINKDKEYYIKKYPETKKWLNECMICHSVGYKPEMPEDIYPRMLAQYIRKYFKELNVNDISICNDCSKHWTK